MVEEGAGRGAIHGPHARRRSVAGALPGTLAAVDPTVAFAELLSRPGAGGRPRPGGAAHRRPRPPRPRRRRRARPHRRRWPRAAPTGDLASVLGHLFGRLGFQGNPDDYYDPCNSYLDRVVATRTGHPDHAVGADHRGGPAAGHRPGRCRHARALPRALGDRRRVSSSTPSATGRCSTSPASGPCSTRCTAPMLRSRQTMLAPVGPRVVATRMLNNLVAIFSSRRDQHGRLWALRLRAAIPGCVARGPGRGGRRTGGRR